MLKVDITSARVRTRGRFATTGSAIAGTIEGSCVGMDLELDVESGADREKMLHVMRQAEQGCYAMGALQTPTEVGVITRLNGEQVSRD